MSDLNERGNVNRLEHLDGDSQTLASRSLILMRAQLQKKQARFGRGSSLR